MGNKSQIAEVSVLLPVYNGERFIRAAILSILDQSFRDLSLIVLDDCSTDNTADIIRGFSDKRITFVQNSTHQGISRTLNYGISLTSSRFIARMDGDDISHRHRLVRQIEFMKKNPHIDVCGCRLQLFGECSSEVWRYASDNASVQCEMLFRSPMPHAAVLLRRKILADLQISYRPEYDGVEDFDLWARLAPHVQFANLQQILYFYRRHAANSSHEQRDHIRGLASQVRRAQVERVGLSPTREEQHLHDRISGFDFDSTVEFMSETRRWLERLHATNARTRSFSEPFFSRILAHRLLSACYYARSIGREAWNIYTHSTLSRYWPRSPGKLAKLWIASRL